MTQAICLSIAGSDSGGGAGIQADIKTFFDLGCHPTTVITAITAQNSYRVTAIEAVSDVLFEKQLQAVEGDLFASAVKTGMIASVKQVQMISKFLDRHNHLSYICDPVMMATSGNQLVHHDVIDEIKTELFPKAALITPNLDEAYYLLSLAETTEDLSTLSLKEIALRLYKTYKPKAVLVKGGHSLSPEIDYFYCPSSEFYLKSQRCMLHKNTHGSGCTLAAAITSFLALGYDLVNAIVIAKAYITEAIFNAKAITKNSQNKPVNQCGFPSNKKYFPIITKQSLLLNHSKAFRKLEDEIGFYPVVDNINWLEYLAKKGIKTIQLRIKDQSDDLVEQAIIEAVGLQKKYNLQLIINDYWQLAIKHGAFGIHLGHEDLTALSSSEIQCLISSNIALGLSTHDYFELAYALSIRPSYVALGPIYPTTSKVMRFKAQGLDKLVKWQALVDIPLVAIGGITLDNIQKIIDTKVAGIAVISMLTKAKEPKQVINKVNRLLKHVDMNEALV
ncbi:bifunctional hydroxymethylpyrimidine kinase/phosphomethylpyrimidine kinase [Thiotrichales bacterium 19S3-7]|nr:bifunctional hydroxymethylpyrimidine kinase/phosphomethylpyrimidine kinase [Thiotrichales bacterium 19S3-7]MCF6800646.1 bifunctional hydroxymethylpyrimidine kinase/phosphomethylpyrimidine kinase [Thiotrichales bacterium 19S3-11]